MKGGSIGASKQTKRNIHSIYGDGKMSNEYANRRVIKVFRMYILGIFVCWKHQSNEKEEKKTSVSFESAAKISCSIATAVVAAHMKRDKVEERNHTQIYSWVWKCLFIALEARMKAESGQGRFCWEKELRFLQLCDFTIDIGVWGDERILCHFVAHRTRSPLDVLC